MKLARYTRHCKVEIIETLEVLVLFLKLSYFLKKAPGMKDYPLHLIASHISLYRTKIFREVAGDVDPKIIPPHYENPIQPIIRRYAHIQDKEGNIPLHLAVLNKNWELARFLAERFGTPLIKNNDGYTPAWLIAKTIPFQLNRSYFNDSDHCYQAGWHMLMYSNTMFDRTGIDENEWNLLHWIAFKRIF